MHDQDPAKVAERLRDDEVHVWRLAYQHQEGRAPFQALLGCYLGLSQAQVQLELGEFGKPRLSSVHVGNLHFNWSHSIDQALFAVARGIEPGVDLEQLRPRPRAMAIAERYFSPDEAAILAGVPAHERDAVFLQMWTAKEAVLKATGRGLAFGLHRLSIGWGHRHLSLRALEGDDVTQWQLHRLPLDDAHVASLAWRGEPRVIEVRALAPSGQ